MNEPVTSFKVYKAESPGMPRDHHAIFVETNIGTSGRIFHVTGTIAQGMLYEEKEITFPDVSYSQEDMTLLGAVDKADLDQFRQVCQSIPPPKKQFEGPKRLYPKEPLRRCQEWTVEAIDALKIHGVLKTSQDDGKEA
ncbi:hypothetical protein KC343_g8763 [Hortaea werneckii]|nr:hypothetical protein KC323_g4379 [Hortaea werneckii]KAI6867477.1 hypothetical protein KC338_g4390 [Hortaea werneckii]KAI7211337.1 hypothetical protein KC352_g17097 [Hortaea werneckii]KAI7352644.1 hypothetical protein KC320_g4387 [Hortaea werneckii]KAI7562968.1 hypothetical protein KC317_g8053 [Hortaea werneckii]